MWIAQAAAASNGDKYKVTDDGDMKARAIWRENRAVPAKTATMFVPRNNAPLVGLCVF
jgi:hypothetical protein